MGKAVSVHPLAVILGSPEAVSSSASSVPCSQFRWWPCSTAWSDTSLGPAAPRTPGRHQPITVAGRPRMSRLVTQLRRRSTPPGVAPTRRRPTARPQRAQARRRGPEARRMLEARRGPRGKPAASAQQPETPGRIPQVPPTRGRVPRGRGADGSELIQQWAGGVSRPLPCVEGTGVLRPDRVLSSAGEGLHRLDLDLDGLSVGRFVGARVSGLDADDGGTERRLLREDVDIGVAGDLAVAQQEPHRVAGDGGVDHGAGSHGLAVAVAGADLRVAQQHLELTDACLLLALLVTRRVITAVLLQVTLVAGGFDLLSNLCTTRSGEMLEFLRQTVKGFLGQPCFFLGDFLGHDFSFFGSVH